MAKSHEGLRPETNHQPANDLVFPEAWKHGAASSQVFWEYVRSHGLVPRLFTFIFDSNAGEINPSSLCDGGLFQCTFLAWHEDRIDGAPGRVKLWGRHGCWEKGEGFQIFQSTYWR